jgi:hypothetical protein
VNLTASLTLLALARTIVDVLGGPQDLLEGRREEGRWKCWMVIRMKGGRKERRKKKV